MSSDCAVCTDLASCDALIAVTEDIASDQVHPAENKDDNTRADNDSPERKPERLLTCGWFVEVAEHVDAENDHRERECDETVSWTQQRPVACEVSAEQ